MRTRVLLVCLSATALLLAGCTNGIDTRRFQSRLVRGATPDEVFQVGHKVLLAEFGRVHADPGARTIVSLPVEYATSSDSGTARDFYGGRSRMRRTAHFAVSGGANPTARLRIDIERQDTSRREAFDPQTGRLDDAPGHTAIERDAATSTQQNTVWTFVKRDTKLERQLLAEIEDRLAPESPPEEATGG